ncbi:MAG: flagellar export chaperone FlgN [Myxococcus sp.]|nr:flagellar export chaperone FlgN [Myxococcus sp.]
MPLEAAISLSLQLRDALAAEVKRSRTARGVLKAMQVEALLLQASERDAFNQTSGQLSDAIAQALGEVAAAHDQRDVTLEQLIAWYPFEAAQLGAVFGEVRALTNALKELDLFNQALAERALTFVRAYVSHLAPRPAAYGRRGALVATEASTHSEHA